MDVTWPPDISEYVPDKVRQCSVYFLYEQWHSELDDMLLRPLGLPRFAIKLYIPKLTLVDVMLMYLDIQLSMWAARGIDIPGAPAEAASLMSAVNDFLRIEMSVQAELSLIESAGVPEWGGEPVKRGLYLNMTALARFIGFKFDFHLEAELRLPNPDPTAFMKFFSDPMKVVTGQVSVADLGVKFGILIMAKAELPFFSARLDFFGKITMSSFELRASSFFQAGPFLLDVNLEVLVSVDTGLKMAFGGELDAGPLGYVAAYGELSSSPAYFMLNGTFCKPMFGFDMTGSLEINSRTGKLAFEMRTGLGFLGYIEFKGLIQKLPSGVRIQGSATIDLTRLHQIFDDLVNTIIKAISGTTDPDSSIVAKALKLLFQAFNPMMLLKRGTIYYDNLAGSMGIELVLDIFGERKLGFSLPTPIRRRMLSAIGESLPDWPHPDDKSVNATARRALSSGCSGGVPSLSFSVKDLTNKIAQTFSNLVEMARSIAPNDTGFEFEAAGMLGFKIAGKVRFQLARSGHMSIELMAKLHFIGMKPALEPHPLHVMNKRALLYNLLILESRRRYKD